MKKINLHKKFSRFSDHWKPHRIAVVDNMQVLLAKLKGDFIWHQHQDEDELFLVQKGILEMHFRDRVEVLEAGEMIVVPKGVEHCPKTRDGQEVEVLLFEKLSTKHTGDTQHELTQNEYPEL